MVLVILVIGNMQLMNYLKHWKYPFKSKSQIFKQLLGVGMGGNASPFIVDLYFSWCEYCYATKLAKTDYPLAKRLSCSCRYLDDICTVNLKDIGTIAKNIYMQL